jgi:hypothetical protein
MYPRRWNGGIHEGRPTRGPQGAARSVECENYAAASADEVVERVRTLWREKYRCEPPSALIGVTLV